MLFKKKVTWGHLYKIACQILENIFCLGGKDMILMNQILQPQFECAHSAGILSCDTAKTQMRQPKICRIVVWELYLIDFNFNLMVIFDHLIAETI